MRYELFFAGVLAETRASLLYRCDVFVRHAIERHALSKLNGSGLLTYLDIMSMSMKQRFSYLDFGTANHSIFMRLQHLRVARNMASDGEKYAHMWRLKISTLECVMVLSIKAFWS